MSIYLVEEPDTLQQLFLIAHQFWGLILQISEDRGCLRASGYPLMKCNNYDEYARYIILTGLTCKLYPLDTVEPTAI
jgi:hypothetical protein